MNYVDDDFSIDDEKLKRSASLKQETEFFNEESNIVYDLVSVRRVKLPKNGENWNFLFNKKVQFTLNGIKFTNKEREFMRTPKGIITILQAYKDGLRSVSAFKERIKCQK